MQWGMTAGGFASNFKPHLFIVSPPFPLKVTPHHQTFFLLPFPPLCILRLLHFSFEQLFRVLSSSPFAFSALTMTV